MIENQSSRDDERAAEYRSAVFGAVAPANWREILETARREALGGDQRAREWVQRVLGIADAIRTQGALEELACQITHSELLDAVSAMRTADYHAKLAAERGGMVEMNDDETSSAGAKAAPTRSERLDDCKDRGAREEGADDDAGAAVDDWGPGAPYWRQVFRIITPAIWERIVAGACADAMEGEPRAREWLIKVLGAENVVDAQGLHDEQSRVVTIGTLVREIDAEKRRKGLA